ncbi:MAG: non-canonical purine NTP pyrophosphatase, partial [Endomicrobium sp.]|nr:non-canonical purine NTP pyrophosphatase [Endomicrobium sp.]
MKKSLFVVLMLMCVITSKLWCMNSGDNSKEIILATGNKHKVEEVKSILKDLDIEIVPMMFFSDYPRTV